MNFTKMLYYSAFFLFTCTEREGVILALEQIDLSKGTPNYLTIIKRTQKWEKTL